METEKTGWRDSRKRLLLTCLLCETVSISEGKNNGGGQRGVTSYRNTEI